MKHYFNTAVRQLMLQNGIQVKDIATVLNVTRSRVSQLLDKPMTDSQTERIMQAISELTSQRTA